MKKKYLIPLLSLLILVSCKEEKNSFAVREIYESGMVDNWKDFEKIDNDTDTLEDVFRYKPDTLFVVKVNYGANRKVFRGYAFYYNNMKEGKWILRDFDGRLYAEHNFVNDKENGFSLIYNADTSKIKIKQYYDKGNLLYEVEYDDNGILIDSSRGQNGH